MAKEQLVMKATGLHTFADVLSKVPEGSLKVASNIVINKDGLTSPRRGFENLDGISSLGDIKSIHTYKNTVDSYVLIHHDTDSVSYYTGSSWSEFAQTLDIPDGAERIRTVEYNNNIYLTSNTGVQKIDDVGSPIVDAGAPQASRLSGAVTGSNGWFLEGTTYDTRVAYRALWGYRDANNVLILGSPSQREEVSNQKAVPADVDVALTVYIPPSIINNWHVNRSWFFQVYRSPQSEDTAASVTTPSDNMQLAYEANPDIATSTLAATIDDDDTSFSCATGEGVNFPSGHQVVVIGSEQIHVSSRTADAFTVAASGRGYNNTTASAHTAGADLISSADIYNTYVSFTDLQPDELLGADLYTNSTQQGILQSNDEPPLCRDMALYQNHMFYANTTGKHSASFRLEGTSLTGISSAITNDPLADDGLSIVVDSGTDFPATNFVIQIV